MPDKRRPGYLRVRPHEGRTRGTPRSLGEWEREAHERLRAAQSRRERDHERLSVLEILLIAGIVVIFMVVAAGVLMLALRVALA